MELAFGYCASEIQHFFHFQRNQYFLGSFELLLWTFPFVRANSLIAVLPPSVLHTYAIWRNNPLGICDHEMLLLWSYFLFAWHFLFPSIRKRASKLNWKLFSGLNGNRSLLNYQSILQHDFYYLFFISSFLFWSNVLFPKIKASLKQVEAVVIFCLEMLWSSEL